MKSRSKFRRVVTILTIVFILFVSLGAGYVLAQKPDNYVEDWLHLRSPDGQYEIIVQRVDRPSGLALFAQPTVQVIVNNGRTAPVKYFRTTVPEKSAPLDDDNYEIEWIDGGAIITFKGTQKPYIYTIKWDQVFQEL